MIFLYIMGPSQRLHSDELSRHIVHFATWHCKVHEEGAARQATRVVGSREAAW